MGLHQVVAKTSGEIDALGMALALVHLMISFATAMPILLFLQNVNERESPIIVPSTAFPTIEAGVSEAHKRKYRDDVRVLPGVYGLTRSIQLTGSVRVRSAAGPQQTILDAGFSARCFWVIGGTRDIVVDGFTMRNGQGPIGGAMQIRDASPRISNCVFLGNHADFWGGAISIHGYRSAASPVIEDCRFVGNTTNVNGGGAIGMVSGSNRPWPVPEHRLVVRRCEFRGNRSILSGSGGAFLFGVGETVISDCSFSNNDSAGPAPGSVGILYSDTNSQSAATCLLSNSVLVDNGANANQSVLRVCGATLTVVNCVLFGTQAVASIDVESQSYLAHQGRLVAVNSILWTSGLPQILASGRNKFLRPSFVHVRHSVVRGGWPGTGNLDKDPMLANAASGNVRLLPGSPCIDAGTTLNVRNLPARDFEGDPRRIGAAIDIGPDEWNPSARLLWTDRASLASNAPGRIAIDVYARPSEAFIALPTLSGTRPGFDIGRLHVPINPDPITNALWPGLTGTANGSGRGRTVLDLGWVPRELAGRELSFASIFARGLPSGPVLGASNADTVRIR